MDDLGRYKVVIADDEEIILTNLAKKIEPADSRFVVAGTAGDGKQALGLVGKIFPEVLITDLRMPVMNGLELIRAVALDHPYMKVIILSGHEDFESARAAMQYGVRRYLLKPVRSSELKEALEGIATELGEASELVDGILCRGRGSGDDEAEKNLVHTAEMYIRARYRTDMDFRILAAACGTTMSKLCKLFRKWKDDTPAHFAVGLKISEACRLLVQKPGLDVKTIGELVGYDDPFHFSRTFRRFTDTSPSAYRSAGLKENGTNESD